MNKLLSQHGIKMALLLLFGAFGVLACILPVMAFLWIFFGWDYMERYSVTIALMGGLTISMMGTFFDQEYPKASRRPVIYFYFFIMTALVLYAIFAISVTTKEAEAIPNMTAEESEAFDRRQECARIKRQYMEGAMDNFEGRSSPYDDLVAPVYCR